MMAAGPENGETQFRGDRRREPSSSRRRHPLGGQLRATESPSVRLDAESQPEQPITARRATAFDFVVGHSLFGGLP